MHAVVNGQLTDVIIVHLLLCLLLFDAWLNFVHFWLESLIGAHSVGHWHRFLHYSVSFQLVSFLAHLCVFVTWLSQELNVGLLANGLSAFNGFSPGLTWCHF